MMSEFWQLVATSGITIAGVIAGVCTVTKLVLDKLGKYYVERALETHKQAFLQQAEIIKSQLRTDEEIVKQTLGNLYQGQQVILKAEEDRRSQLIVEAQRLAGQKVMA